MNINIDLFFSIFIIQVFIGSTACNPNHCFAVLDKLPKKEVETIYFMNFKDVAHSHPATDILSCFLRVSHSGDESLIEQYFNVFRKCDEYTRTNFANQQLEELAALGLPYSLEMYLRKKLEAHNRKELQQGLLHVQDVMSKDIELSQNYKDFKYFISKKIKPNTGSLVKNTLQASENILNDLS